MKALIGQVILVGMACYSWNGEIWDRRRRLEEGPTLTRYTR